MGEGEWFGSEKGSLGFHIVTLLPYVPVSNTVAVGDKVMLRVQFKVVDRLILRTSY